MDLTANERTKCPYDGTDVEAEMVSGGMVLLVCPHCGGEWESHGAWTREVHAPVGATGRGDDDALPGDDITITP
jgi:hypothetical protein